MNNLTYNQMLQPYSQNYLPQQNVIRVNGKNGADALRLQPNSSIFVADDTKPDRIWLCMTDGAGYKTVKAFVTQPEEMIEQNSIEERLSKVEEYINEQRTRTTKSKQRSKPAADVQDA